MSSRRRLFVWLSLALLAAFFAVFLVWPILYVLQSAVVYEGRWTTQFFADTLRNPILQQSVVNSLALGAAVTLATTFVALPLALVSVRRDFFGRRWMSALVMLPLILPPFVGAIGMKQMFARGGSVNLVLEQIFYGITWCLSQIGLMGGPWHMPPHPEVSAAQARVMADYILSLR